MISTDVFANTFGAVPAGDTEKLVKIAILAVRNGFAVVLNRPKSKQPLCPLTARNAKIADAEAQATARESGDQHWDRRRHACGIHHAFTDDKQMGTAIRRVIKNHGSVNLGVEVGRSRMVVVDVDTAAQRDAFLAAWTAAEGRDMTSMPPTVKSPGAKIGDVWAHKDGGHYWFTIPAGTDLPTGTSGVLVGDGGWSVLFRDKQVLVPPSAREEGSYRLVGQATEIPGWLADFIRQGSREQADRRTTGILAARTSTSPIEKWAAEKPWPEILEADGWTDTGKADRCGCPIWTAPGDHASPKSATAHEVGCGQWSTPDGHAPLHIWTDNPPDCVSAAVAAKGKSITKLTYIAYRLYDGNMAAAIAGEGIDDSMPTDSKIFEAVDAAGVTPSQGDSSSDAPESGDDLSGDGGDDLDDFGLPSGEAAPAGGAPKAARKANPTLLPEEFWEARPELRHIRQASRSRLIPPDAVMHGVLTRLAAMVPGTLKVDTTILEPIGLNYFAAMVAESGVGKSTSVKFAGRLLRSAPIAGGLILEPRPLGSGEGISESYMGTREEPTGETYRSGPRRGEEKTRSVRTQTLHNALFYLDEGESLTKLMNERSGATLGQQLRTAWSGGILGQANGTAERTRIVKDYSMGLLIGYQPETAYLLLDGMMQGTPQRFVWCRVVDPGLPDTIPEWPGELELDLGDLIADPADDDPEPMVITVCEKLKRDLIAVQIAKTRGQHTDDHKNFNSQRQATMIKMAGLLAVLAGRDTVTEDDWSLAGMIWRTSSVIRDMLVAARDREARSRVDEKRERDIETAKQVAMVTGVLDPKIERLAKRLVEIVTKDGSQKIGYFNQKINHKNRGLIPDAVEHAIDEGWLLKGDDDELRKGPKAP